MNVQGDFECLTAELRKRFTPVRIQGVDTSLFHERKQKPGESVDAYAQELRRLHHKAYPESIHAAHGNWSERVIYVHNHVTS